MAKANRAILAALLLSTAPLQASAQNLTVLSNIQGTASGGGGGGSYHGPGDDKAFAMWWGTYAYSSATRGTNAIRLCKPSDSACADVISNATTGIVDNPTIGGTPCGSGADLCTGHTIYCQVGSCSLFDQVQATEALRAVWLPNCTGLLSGIGCLVGTGSSWYSTSGTFTSSQPISMFFAANTDSGGSASGLIGWTDTGGDESGAGAYWFGNPDTYFCYAGSGVTKAGSDGSWRTQGCTLNGNPNSVISLDAGVTTGADAGLRTADSAVRLLRAYYGNMFTGKFASAGVATSAFNSTDMGNLNTTTHDIVGF